jgi:hypothetical protein
MFSSMCRYGHFLEQGLGSHREVLLNLEMKKSFRIILLVKAVKDRNEVFRDGMASD